MDNSVDMLIKGHDECSSNACLLSVFFVGIRCLKVPMSGSSSVWVRFSALFLTPLLLSSVNYPLIFPLGRILSVGM